MTSDNEMDSMDIFLTKHAEEIREFWLAQYPQTKEEVPKHKFSWRFRWKMRRLMREYDKRYRYKQSKISRPVRVAVLAVCLVVVMSVSAVASSPELRSIFFNTRIYENENGINIDMSYDGEWEASDSVVEIYIDDFDVEYMPDGYTLNSKTIYPTKIIYEFESEDGKLITILKVSGNSTNVTISNDGCELTYEIIDDCKAMVYENKEYEEVTIAWTNEREACFYEVLTEGVNRSEAVKVANGLKDIEE